VARLHEALVADRATTASYLDKVAPARLGDVPVYAVQVGGRHAGLGSDIGNAVAAKFGGVAVVWRREGARFRYSLRSVPSIGPDVTALAQLFGGGGHQHAAGCQALRQLLRFGMWVG
jgi:hypothetical protein